MVKIKDGWPIPHGVNQIFISSYKVSIGADVRTYSFFAALVFLFALASCSSVTVSQDYNAATDFSSFQTYGWLIIEKPDNPDIRVNNPLLQSRFSDAINIALQQRGYRSSDPPDFLVTYDYSIKSKIQSDNFGTGFSMGYGGRRNYGAFGFGANTVIHQYDVGTLVIDIYNAQPDDMIWRGTGTEIVTTHSTPEALTTSINRLVQQILVQFPPK